MKTIRIEKPKDLQFQMRVAWDSAKAAVQTAGIVVEIRRYKRSREQEKKFHAMLQDFAKQITFYGNKKHKLEIWKALFVEQFAKEKELLGEPLRHQGQTITSLDGLRTITVRPSTTQFLVAEAADFIEYLYQQGAEMGVNFSDRALAAYNSYQEAQPAAILFREEKAIAGEVIESRVAA
jgi:hypothetical protein